MIFTNICLKKIYAYCKYVWKKYIHIAGIVLLVEMVMVSKIFGCNFMCMPVWHLPMQSFGGLCS